MNHGWAWFAYKRGSVGIVALEVCTCTVHRPPTNKAAAKEGVWKEVAMERTPKHFSQIGCVNFRMSMPFLISIFIPKSEELP